MLRKFARLVKENAESRFLQLFALVFSRKQQQNLPSIPWMDNHPIAPDHNDIWVNELSKASICNPVKTLPLETPVFADRVRFVCISDTHEMLGELMTRHGTVSTNIPDGDVLIHAGDFTNTGERKEILRFNEQLGSLPHRVKIVVAGNHELGFEDGETGEAWLEKHRGKGTFRGYELLTNCTYLCDSAVKVFGLTIYGSPWHSLPGYSFYRKRGERIAEKWNMIPENVDVLVTHSPPLGYLDIWTISGRHCGCADLLAAVRRQQKPPAYHVFGHMHEQNGAVTDGRTIFVNAAISSQRHPDKVGMDVKCLPVLFDLPLADGCVKDEILSNVKKS